MQILLPLTLTVAIAGALNAKDGMAIAAIFASLGIANGLVTIMVWGCTEFLQMMRKNSELLENPLNPLRDLKHEKTARIWARLAHLAAVLALASWMWL